MFEFSNEYTFQASEPSPSASSVRDALQGTMQGTASECSEVQGYSVEQIMDKCSIARRTAFKYAAEVLEVWFWLPEYEFRINGVYSTLALAELKRRKALGSLENYRNVVHRENGKAIATYQQEKQPTQPPTTKQPIEAEILDESPAPMIHVPDVQGLSRLDLARSHQSEVQRRLSQTLEEFKQWDDTLNAEIAANKEATVIEGQASFDEKVIDLLLRKKDEQDRLKKLEALIDSGAISADELLKRYAGSASEGNV